MSEDVDGVALARALVLGVLADGAPRDLPAIALDACPMRARTGSAVRVIGMEIEKVLPGLVALGEVEEQPVTALVPGVDGEDVPVTVRAYSLA
ncbi:hypothetical protein J4573_33085 [Actinomadura barringtoniae]|uniref:Uncharacterized protein n=1 Tax=Actinomadura barringtoniae TaxID=1427535 RepID=A0A939PGR3_9ACTN|nr:hypothetical protein [Actinomadura barringtoniae]MBO2451963.1 hypothetical protein [Actinomadura barringtoniae]